MGWILFTTASAAVSKRRQESGETDAGSGCAGTDSGTGEHSLMSTMGAGREPLAACFLPRAGDAAKQPLEEAGDAGTAAVAEAAAKEGGDAMQESPSPKQNGRKGGRPRGRIGAGEGPRSARRRRRGRAGQGREEGESSGFGSTGEDERGDFNVRRSGVSFF